MPRNDDVAYGQTTLPSGVRSRYVRQVNGLTMHILEAGFKRPGRPCLLLLHGFPELAYSWRKQLLPLAQAGYHVVAPDQRGYGQTTGWDGDYDGDLAPFRMLNLVKDVLALVYALGYRSVAAVAGHDYGSQVAGYCALIRPDVFPAVALGGPFPGAPSLPVGAADQLPQPGAADLPNIHDALAALPRPRKHYQAYYTTREANANMRHCPQGVHAFLRAYTHYKSADWPGNHPFPLKAWVAEELAKMPTYYIMDLDQGMAETVAPHMPTPDQVASCRWLTEDELRVYSNEYARTGFQGGLNWYRCSADPRMMADLQVFAGRSIDVPSCIIAGAHDWGLRQRPGALEKAPEVCTRLLGVHIVEGAGHWVQQEQPEAVTERLLAFLRSLS